MALNLSRSSIYLFLFFVISFFLTRQVPFSDYSIISNVALMGLICLQMPKEKRFLFYCIVLFSLCFYSYILGNKINYIIRFFIILLSISAAYYIRIPIKAIKILIYLALLQAIVILGFELYMVFFTDRSIALAIRTFFIGKGWGDIYTFNGIFYKIQIKGAAILPFVYMILYSCEPLINNKIKSFLYKTIILLACLCAGNFAYLIIIVLFHLYKYFSSVKSNAKWMIYRIYIFLIVGLISFSFVYGYIKSTLEMKSEESNAVRIDQANVLYNDLSENTLTLFFGSGLGHTITVSTGFRDYNELIYYELQFLYIFNQLGILFFISLLIYLGILTLERIKYKDLLILYLLYITYAITNPYIFDTNHFIVIIILCSLSDYRIKSNRKITYFK